MRRMFKWLPVLLVGAVTSAMGKTGREPKKITIQDLLPKRSQGELVKLLGAATISDSSDILPSRESTLPLKLKELIFEPVNFEGFRSIVEATLAGDSTMTLQIFLPYIGRPATRLKIPIEMTSYVHATADDFAKVQRSIEQELGEPTVMTGLNFEYMAGNTQTIYGVFENGEVRITVLPQLGEKF